MGKRFFLSLLSCLLAVLLMWFFIRVLDVSYLPVLSRLRNISPLLLTFVVLSTLVNFLLVAVKWRFIATKLAIENVPYISYLFYVALGTIFGLVLPQQLSFIMVRSLALRLKSGHSITRSSFSVLYDVFFTFYPVFLLSMAALFIISHVGDTINALVVCLLFITVGCVVLVISASRFQVVLLKVYKWMRLRRGKPVVSDDLETNVNNFFRVKATGYLLLLSLLQNVNLIFRNYIIAYAGGFDIPFMKILFAYPLIFLSMIIGITPGGFGVVEWSWVGTLSFLGFDKIIASQYALVNRGVILFSQISVFILVVLVAVIMKKRIPSRVRD